MTQQTSNLIQHFQNQGFDARKVLEECKKNIHLNTFFRNYDNLIDSADIINFTNDSWNLRPYAFCEDYYGSSFFYPVVLISNNIGTIFDFTTVNLNGVIIAPNKNTIIELLSLQTK